MVSACWSALLTVGAESPVCLPISRFICPSAFSSVRLSTHKQVHLSVCFFVRPFVSRFLSLCLMPFWPTISPSVHPSIRLSVHPPIRLFIHETVHPTISSSVRLPIRLSVRPTVRLSVHQTAYPNISPSVCPSVHPPIRLSVHPTNNPSVRFLILCCVSPLSKLEEVAPSSHLSSGFSLIF